MAEQRGPGAPGPHAQQTPATGPDQAQPANVRIIRNGNVTTSPGQTVSAQKVPGSGDAPDGVREQRIADLEAALATAKATAAENWDKYLRERAEMENYKRRLERNYADQAKRAAKELILKFLGVVDNIERAVTYESTTGKEADARSLITGLRMTYLQSKELLSGAGLTEVPTVGLPFDPAVHEAVATEVTAKKPEGEIVAEVQKGYRYQDELLRPARVKVATRP